VGTGQYASTSLRGARTPPPTAAAIAATALAVAATAAAAAAAAAARASCVKRGGVSHLDCRSRGVRWREHPEEGDREGHGVLEAVGQVREALLCVVVPGRVETSTTHGEGNRREEEGKGTGAATREGGTTMSHRDHRAHAEKTNYSRV